jgi:hypothetical protein
MVCGDSCPHVTRGCGPQAILLNTLLARLLPFLGWRQAAFQGAIAVDDVRQGEPHSMKGPGYEDPICCGASTEAISASFFHPNISEVPRAVARGRVDDRSPAHHEYCTYRAASRKRSCLLVASGVVAATLVLLGTFSPGDRVSAHLRRAEGACILGWG